MEKNRLRRESYPFNNRKKYAAAYLRSQTSNKRVTSIQGSGKVNYSEAGDLESRIEM